MVLRDMFEVYLLLISASAYAYGATITREPRAETTLPPDFIGYTSVNGKCEPYPILTYTLILLSIMLICMYRFELELSRKFSLSDHRLIRTMLFNSATGLFYGDGVCAWERDGERGF